MAAEYDLPVQTVHRVIKDALPAGISVSRDVKTSFARSGSIFITYLSQMCLAVSKKSKRSTIQAQDVLTALEENSFEEFLPQLQEALEAFQRKESEAKAKRPVRPKPSKSDQNEPAEEEGEKGAPEDQEEQEDKAAEDDQAMNEDQEMKDEQHDGNEAIDS
eukprot:TRINITY_DN8385_c0_g1_i1.p1 TRINITY_DN8385_c0_g1~~TRINITY_DN8385_c0_g1_i1.p1  ORF type:complete len:161 (-),score=14.81 TRINITY_DN8385_c0_g1_i1:38-520(-)